MKFNGLTSLLCGLLFGIGLIMSGMTNPAKVIGFLDINGQWDPSLMFVMVGAIAVSAVGYALIRKTTSGHSLFGELLHWPAAQKLDAKLIVGSLLFGLGWGMAGICPAPGLVLLARGEWQGGIFVLTMLLGMVVFELQSRYQAYKHDLQLSKAEQNG